MSFDYSISYEGIRAAGRSLSEAARKVASINKSGQTQNEQSKSGDVDFAAALLQANRAEMAAKANLNLLSNQQELEHKILDILA
jgi:hypothetical protein